MMSPIWRLRACSGRQGCSGWPPSAWLEELTRRVASTNHDLEIAKEVRDRSAAATAATWRWFSNCESFMPFPPPASIKIFNDAAASSSPAHPHLQPPDFVSGLVDCSEGFHRESTPPGCPFLLCTW